MLRIPEMAMPKTRKVTTVYNGKKEVWDDREEALNFFLRQMMTTEGEERDRAECFYIQLIHGLSRTIDLKRLCPEANGNILKAIHVSYPPAAFNNQNHH